ncbi:MAG: hypothetical protein ABW250_11755 [Pyrinomonadaceae bacterium]
MKAPRRTLFWLALAACVLLAPARALACACCSNAGDYQLGFARPSEYELSIMRQVRFGGAAQLYLTEADMEESAVGLAHRAESYALKGSLAGGVWRLEFRDGRQTGTLSLPLPAKMVSYAADIRDGRTSPGGGPLLYKEWRFEGRAAGTGFFRAGLASPAKYFLVLQGRGNGCQDAGDFTHWRLNVRGPKAEYAFYGQLSDPQ